MNTDIINVMKHSPLFNYGGIPGLTSWLIGGPSNYGTVRLLECSRNHQEPITPHSHRFDFRCLVLRGRVRNVIWEQATTDEMTRKSDLFSVSELTYSGKPGQYEQCPIHESYWYSNSFEYHEGMEYSMEADDVHSIFFEKDTSVLFFEGPQVTNRSIILQPVVNGEIIPTFKVEDWMFKSK